MSVKRPYPRTAPCAVECRADGNQIMALIGPNIQEGVAGFGNDLPAALRSLADSLEREVGQEPQTVRQWYSAKEMDKPIVMCKCSDAPEHNEEEHHRRRL